MITIERHQELAPVFEGSLRELLDLARDKDEQAFIGKVGEGPDNAVYIISYLSAIPLCSLGGGGFSGQSCPIKVYYFVDLKITAVKHLTM